MTSAGSPLDVLHEPKHSRGCGYWPFRKESLCDCGRPAALSAVEQLVETARDTSEPFMDERFRDRLLRHALSNDEIEQFVDAVESSQQRLRQALARFPVPAAVRSREQQEPQA